MKNNVILMACAIIILLVACQKEEFIPPIDPDSLEQDQTSNDGETPDENNEEGDNEEDTVNDETLEEEYIDGSFLLDNVIIAGGTRNEGAPPTPNEAISLDISATDKYGFQDVGFNIVAESDAEIKGAYLLFKSEDGSTVNGYYDIDLRDNYFAYNSKNHSVLEKYGKQKKVNDDPFFGIRFNQNVEPGEFCYEVCVYDEQGNISVPQEFCITIKDWGGNENLVAHWSQTQLEYYENVMGEEEFISYILDVIGEDVCDQKSESCHNSGMIVEYQECYVYEYGELTLNSDGSYYFENYESFNDLSSDYYTTCEEIYIDRFFQYQSSGFWSYIEEEQEIVVIEFSGRERGTAADGTITDTGNLELISRFYEGAKVLLEGNTLIFEEVENRYNNDVIETYRDHYIKE